MPIIHHNKSVAQLGRNSPMQKITKILIVVIGFALTEFRWCKIAFDVVVVTIGMVLGGVFAWGTILTVIGTGPMIQYIRKLIEGRLNRWFDKFDKKSRMKEATP